LPPFFSQLDNTAYPRNFKTQSVFLRLKSHTLSLQSRWVTFRSRVR